MENQKVKLGLFLILFSLVIIVFSQNNVFADTNQQPPADCTSWFDGCNTCEVVDGKVGACTKKGCVEYEKPKCLAYSNQQPPADCTSWFDGCNTCEVVDGKVGACTKKGCVEYEKPKCLAYFDFIYVNPSTKPIEVPSQKKPEVVSYFCSGCELDKHCYPFGYRKSGKFCSDENLEFIEQRQSDDSCENNFECSSNVCVSRKCRSESVSQKVLNWFKKLFG